MNVVSDKPKRQNEIGLLREIIQNIVGPITPEVLGKEEFATTQQTSNGLVGLKHSGVRPFECLLELMYERSVRAQHGTRFINFRDALLNLLLSGYNQRPLNSISVTDVTAIEEDLNQWVEQRTVACKIFVPCEISRWYSPQFNIGPVHFIHKNDFVGSDYYPGELSAKEATHEFDLLLTDMEKNYVYWLAVVEINNCHHDRALELADLATDLAIVAIQLAAPRMVSPRMTRLATRRGPRIQRTLTAIHDTSFPSIVNTEPGLSLGDGCLAKILNDSVDLITSAGNRIQSFANFSYAFPNLEKAWCDAVYWVNQAIAEPLDTIATAMLETAIEVLICWKDTKYNETKILAAISAFYQIDSDYPINCYTETTAKKFAKSLFTDRSRILHGTWSTLNTKIKSDRNSLQYFVISLVKAFVVELDAYIKSPNPIDDVSKFLNFIKEKQAT